MEHIFQNSNFGQDWFSYPKLYKSMVEKFPSRSKFVEVGSWKGKSSAYMAVEIANSGKQIEFYCVDHWEGSPEHYDANGYSYEPDIARLYEIFTENMKPVEEYYKPLRMSSEQASKLFDDKSLDFVFIDAAHDYDSVCQDIDLWKPKVKDGGFLAGHDYYEDVGSFVEFLGLKKAVSEKIESFTVDEFCWIHQISDKIKGVL